MAWLAPDVGRLPEDATWIRLSFRAVAVHQETTRGVGQHGEGQPPSAGVSGLNKAARSGCPACSVQSAERHEAEGFQWFDREERADGLLVSCRGRVSMGGRWARTLAAWPTGP